MVTKYKALFSAIIKIKALFDEKKMLPPKIAKQFLKSMKIKKNFNSRNCSVTRMAFELFPEIASVKTLKWPRGDSRGPFESLN